MNTHFDMQKYKKQSRRRGTKFMIAVNWRMGEGLRPKMKMNFIYGVLLPLWKRDDLEWQNVHNFLFSVVPARDLLSNYVATEGLAHDNNSPNHSQANHLM